ncbi:MAG: hypothetical protein HQL08_05875 [Nitrospirae bacterium]|nr:hypothetical protein [Nitrospirota bacterium]
MTFKVAVYLLIFWLMQVVAQVLFKWGSGSESRWMLGFIGGNLFGFSSIWLLMLIYKAINPNVALGISTGGAFLLGQVALAIAFRSRVAPLQLAGIAAIVVGIIALSLGGPKDASSDQVRSASPDRNCSALDTGR